MVGFNFIHKIRITLWGALRPWRNFKFHIIINSKPEDNIGVFKFSLRITVDTGRKLNVHRTFRRRSGRVLNVLCTFNLRPVSARIVWLVSGKLPSMKFPLCKFPVGKFLLRKLSPGIFPPMILNNSTHIFNLIFSFFQVLWPLSLILIKRLICNFIVFSWWEFFRGCGIFHGEFDGREFSRWEFLTGIRNSNPENSHLEYLHPWF